MFVTPAPAGAAPPAPVGWLKSLSASFGRVRLSNSTSDPSARMRSIILCLHASVWGLFVSRHPAHPPVAPYFRIRRLVMYARLLPGSPACSSPGSSGACASGSGTGCEAGASPISSATSPGRGCQGSALRSLMRLLLNFCLSGRRLTSLHLATAPSAVTMRLQAVLKDAQIGSFLAPGFQLRLLSHCSARVVKAVFAKP